MIAKFDEVLEAAKKKQNVEADSDLNEESLRTIVVSIQKNL